MAIPKPIPRVVARFDAENVSTVELVLVVLVSLA